MSIHRQLKMGGNGVSPSPISPGARLCRRPAAATYARPKAIRLAMADLRPFTSEFWLPAPDDCSQKLLFCQTNPMLFNVFGPFEKPNPKTNPMKPNSHAPSKNESFEKTNPIQTQTVSFPCLGIVPQCFDFPKLVSILLILSKTSPAVALGFVFIRVHSWFKL